MHSEYLDWLSSVLEEAINAQAKQAEDHGETPEAEDDSVNHPNHYADKNIEVIDYIEDTLTHEEYIGYCIGNVLKYVSRWRKKGGLEDLEKAAVYLDWAIKAVE